MRNTNGISEKSLLKHKKAIEGWMKGATIEFRDRNSKNWHITSRQDDISWRLDHEYRVALKNKKD